MLQKLIEKPMLNLLNTFNIQLFTYQPNPFKRFPTEPLEIWWATWEFQPNLAALGNHNYNHNYNH